MSKGHGKWERAILQALEEVPAFYLTDLLPDPHTRSQTAALNRAARNLCDAGKIELLRWLCRAAGGPGLLTRYCPRQPPPTPTQITKIASVSFAFQLRNYC